MSTENLPPCTTIELLGGPLTGACHVPGDKSISHRAVLFAAMAEGTSHLTGVLDSEDVRASIRAVEALGAAVDLRAQPDGTLAGTVTGWGAEGPQQPDAHIDCGNSGTTARLLMGVVAPWGIAILSVEVRDILLPKELQEVMSLEAQAEQRKKARIILMEAEHDIFETLDEMEELVGGPEAVARLRTMHLLNESLREGKGTVVIPSAFAEGFNDPALDAVKDILAK